MKTLNPEGSLKIDTSADRDGEVQMIVENPKPDTAQSVYVGRRLACDIVNHFNAVFSLGYADPPEIKTCTCDLRTQLVGDGCEVCNPELALEHAREIILEQEKTIGDLIVALDEMLATAYDEYWDVRPSCSACLSAAENALTVARGEI